MNTQITIPYTICFCICENQVLLNYRAKTPNQHKWNGVGGKIEEGETKEEAVRREVLEETGIDIQNGEIYFAGVVSWIKSEDGTNENRGMYAYIVELQKEHSAITPLTSGEVFEWKPLEWVLDPASSDVVANIPAFLPLMLEKQAPQEYHCIYENHIFHSLVLKPL